MDNNKTFEEFKKSANSEAENYNRWCYHKVTNIKLEFEKCEDSYLAYVFKKFYNYKKSGYVIKYDLNDGYYHLLHNDNEIIKAKNLYKTMDCIY